MPTIVGVGNCQVHGMIRCVAAALGLAPIYLHPSRHGEDGRELVGALSEAEIVFAQQEPWAEHIQQIVSLGARPDLPVIPVPRLYFPGFHPDLATPLKSAGKCPLLPVGTANSAILLAAWREGLGPEQALTLFREEVYEALGYYDAYPLAREALVKECLTTGLEVEPLIDRWIRSGPFFHVPLHPKINVLNDIAFTLLRNAGLWSGEDHPGPPEDPLASNVIWPVYPAIAERLGFAGSYVFKPNNPRGESSVDLAPMGLESFVERTFAGYRQAPPDMSGFPRMSDPRLASIASFLEGEPIEHYEFGSEDLFEEETSKAMQIVCDEELLDDSGDVASGA